MRMKKKNRDVFYVSDGTAITCETIGRTVVNQFPIIANEKRVPFVENPEKLDELVKWIHKSYEQSGSKPLVFFSIVIPHIREELMKAPGFFYDVLAGLVNSVEQDLDMEAQPKLHRSRSVTKDSERYFDRISAIEYTLAHDDGISLKNLDQADLILLGVSRSGKTPAGLYMAMQFGLRVVNYPFIAEDLDTLRLLPEFEIHRYKLFGLTIDAQRLTEVRENRLAGSQYASKQQCAHELACVETLFRQEAIPYLNTSRLSVEEISTRILEQTGFNRKLC